MSLVTALVAGGLLGIRHAVETDHVAAVAALVDREDDRPGLVGASWGVGHSLPVAAVGLAFLLLGIRFPEVVFTAVEAVVGVVLVALGVRLLAGEVVRLRHAHGGTDDHGHFGVGSFLVGLTHSHRSTVEHEHTHAHTEDHGDGHTHAHGHDHGDGHTHPGLPGRGPAVHAHDDPTPAARPFDRGGFAVGAIHGLAGSGALVVALVATASSVDNALAFLGGFSVCSVATMAAVSAVWGRALDTRGRRLLVTVAGVVGAVVGAGLLAEVAGVASLLAF
ncbi:high-affinity nickel-transporter protein [Salinigranum salinum]|uniref:high-affinity nickel-transporter protein n=1 Tax=Salinigranum salinum TaxID=1364937 RepID=UPI001260D852|nr:high-affinity nickel-transporter protein [Salinigranum salinum]